MFDTERSGDLVSVAGGFLRDDGGLYLGVVRSGLGVRVLGMGVRGLWGVLGEWYLGVGGGGFLAK